MSIDNFVEKEIISIADKERFQRIVLILHRFYELTSSGKREGADFKERFGKTKSKDVQIRLKKIGNWEYHVTCSIGNHEEDNWIHVDGIKEERDALIKEGISDHPVFEIDCVSDLFDRATLI